jgi:hypothetical protein
MSSSAITADERVLDVSFNEDALSVSLRDGRVISVPLVWYPRLLNATAEQRKNWKIAGGGYGIHWPDVDEDLSTEGMLRGARAPRAALKTTAMLEGEPETKYGYGIALWERAKAEAIKELGTQAKRESTITYLDLTKRIGSIAFDPGDHAFHYLLLEVSKDEDAAGRGLLSALVVNKETGMPGQGFFDVARELGRNAADPMRLWTDEIKFVFSKWRQARRT